MKLHWLVRATLFRVLVGTLTTGTALLTTTAARADDEPKAKKAKADDDRTDHERVVGHVGVSYFGVSSLPMGVGAPAGNSAKPAIALGTPSTTTIAAPAIGVRYWFTRTLGVDLGVGIGVSGGSVTDNNNKVGKVGGFGLLLHGGVPLSIVAGKHISLQITPEVNFGFTKATVAPPAIDHAPPDASLGGMRFDVGGRIGGEVQFGFIGLPELALEGSIGAFFTYQSTSVSVGPESHSDVSYSLTTASFRNPWDFFASVVAARYYF